ncbi:hypothetical protein BsWGS_02593 [Bradybaena similaris]
MRRRGRYLLVGLLLVVLGQALVCWQTYFRLLYGHVRDRSVGMSAPEATPAPSAVWRAPGVAGGQKCPSLSGMTEGRWITRPLNETEQVIIDTYLREARRAYKIPPTSQRDDGLCGNTTYKDVTLHKHMWFRAICDSRGATPCCHTYRCLALPQADCRCATCYDERSAIHAEFADWQSADPRCQVLHFHPDLACQLLDGISLYFLGDSFIRHVFAALVISLTNLADGALKEDTPPEVKGRCFGANQITGEECRAYLNHDRLLCQGKVKVRYVQLFSVIELPTLLTLLADLRGSSTSLVVLGLGIHENFNHRVVSKKFLYPALNLRQSLSTNLSAPTPDIHRLMRSWEILGWSPMTSHVTKRDVVKTSVNIGAESVNIGAESVNIEERNSQASGWPGSQRLSGKHTSATIKKDGGGMAEAWMRELYEKYADDLAGASLYLQTLPTPGLDVSRLRPRLLWLGAHAPGLLKSPRFAQQSSAGVEEFNAEITGVLRPWLVPALDTFSSSKGTVSVDGTHYGWGVNKLKVNMLLTYIRNSFSKDGDSR